MQTLQIDKLGTAPFDGTTLLNPAITPVAITKEPSENRTILTIPDGVAVGRIDIGSLLGIPTGNTYNLHDAALGGDFAGSFTGGVFEILGPPNPTNVGRASRPFPLTGGTGIGITGGTHWFLPGSLMAITTVVADTGPYRVVLLVEDLPNQKLMAAIASGEIS